MKNFSEFLNQSSTDSSQKVENSFDLQEKRGIPKKFQGGKITDKNLGYLLDRVGGKYNADVQDLNIIANRTDSKSGTVKMDASDYGKIKQGEVQASKEIVDAHKSGTNKTIEPSRSGNKIKTTSNIGVILGSSVSSTAWFISDLLIMYYSYVSRSDNKSVFFFTLVSSHLAAILAGIAAIKPAIAGIVDLATPPAIALASPPPVTAKI